MDKHASVEHKEAVIRDEGTIGNVKFFDENDLVRRISIPSADPNDPLNFSKWRKLGINFTCCWYSVFSLLVVGGSGPIFPIWIQVYAPQYSVADITDLGSYPSLAMGVGAFAILPLSMVFGRRPIMLGCCALLLGSVIGAGAAPNYSIHLACRILQGVATGATESVLPLIITDISFLDERGFWYGCYWATQSCMACTFTIVNGYIAADLGWRWFYWIIAMLSGFGSIIVFFLLPETRYRRSPLSLNGQVLHTDDFGVTEIMTDVEARRRFGVVVDPSEVTATPVKKSYLATLNPVSPIAPNATRTALSALGKMIASLSSPSILWTVLANSISVGTIIAMTLTYGSILTEEFGWSQPSVGLINCGSFPAAVMALIWAGWFGDRLNLWLARRRGGIHIPEDSLITLIFPTIVSFIGIAVYGITAYQPTTHSSWGIILGWALHSFGFIVTIIASTHFAAEAYPSNPGPAIVTVVGLKSVISFGATYGITPMIQRFNYLTAYMIILGIYGAIALLGIPMYFLNPKWRAKIAARQQQDATM